MKRYLTYFLLISSIFSQDQKLAVSILDFTGEDVKPKVLKACFQRLETSLIDSDQFIVIEKSEREEILKEQQIQSSGICDTECVVDIGQLLGAEYLMLGEIIDLSGLYQIDIKIINVEKGDVTEKVTEEVEGRVKDLLNAMERASDEIIRRISVYKPDASQLLIGQTELIEEVKYGRVNIYSEPSDAIVLIDNDRIGLTPIENKQVEVGTRNLKIIKKGYVTINKGVKISETEIARVDEVLMMKTGGVDITTMPIGSKVFIDDKFVGLSPLRIPEVIIGQHQITASHEDYLTGLENIIVEYDKVKDIKLSLSPKLGSVNIVLSITDVDISINYKKYPSDPSGFTSIKLVPGDYEVRISKTGYKTETRTVKILPNRSETLEIEMYLREKTDFTITEEQASILNQLTKDDKKLLSYWTHKLNGKILANHIKIEIDKAIIREYPREGSNIKGGVQKNEKLKIISKYGDYLQVEIPKYKLKKWYSGDLYKDKNKLKKANKTYSPIPMTESGKKYFTAAVYLGIIWMFYNQS